MPTISRFFGLLITLDVIESTLARRQLRLLLAWAELHGEEVAENWRQARTDETLNPIDPRR